MIKEKLDLLIENFKTSREWKVWVASKHSPWWSLIIAFVALEYAVVDWPRAYMAQPFNLDALTDVLLIWNQRLLHIPLFMMAYMVVAPRWSWRGLGLVFIAIWCCTNYAWIDIDFHQWLSANDLYPNRWKMQNGQANANYAKIILWMVAAPLFLLRFTSKKHRTMDRAFVMLMTVSLLCTHLLFHWVWIKREYMQIQQREMTHIHTVLKTEESSFRDMCKNSTWDCWLGVPNRKNDPHVSEIMIEGMKKAMTMDVCKQKPCVFISGSFDPAQNEFSPSPVGVFFKDGKWRIVADTKFIAVQFLQIRQSLTTLGIAAGNVWTYGLILLWAMHRRRFKKRATQKQREWVAP